MNRLSSDLKGLLLVLSFFCTTVITNAAVRLPRFFSDGMVLQRNRPVALWGWALPGQQVSIALRKSPVVELRKASKTPRVLCETTATADAQGRWKVVLPQQKAQGPLQLQVIAEGEQPLVVNDVWVGDVWLFSGQSNIDTNLERVHPQYPDEIDNDSTSRVRLFKVQNNAVLEAPRDDVQSAGWQMLSRRSAWHFTALGYFMGKRMEAATGVVQGIVQCSWGGTPIESWLSRDEVQQFDPLMVAEAEYHSDAELRRKTAEANALAVRRWNELLARTDPGVVGHWEAADFDDSHWPSANQFSLPMQPEKGFCGTYWLRQHIRIDAAHAGQQARLLLGTLVDADFTYLNGRQIGSTGYQYPPRRYTIPAGLLREGDNVLTVRFVNKGMLPHFVEEKPYQIVWSDGSIQPLSQEWRVHDGTQMPPQPSLPSDYQYMASAAYNGMLSPLAPMTLAGAVWYQGESNTDHPVGYEQRLQSLMKLWRERFEQPELPFVVVQLANFMKPSEQPQESNWAQLREEQRRAVAADDHAALVVALGLGEANDIHPLRKKELAERCALAFDKLVFGKNVALSPQPMKVERTAGKLFVTFDQPLSAGSVHGFELSVGDQPFRNVEASAVGNVVSISLSQQQNEATQLRVRYAWKDNPVEADCRNAVNSLPATSFEWACP